MVIRMLASFLALWLALLTVAFYDPLAVRVLRAWLAPGSERQGIAPVPREVDDFSAYIEWLAVSGCSIRQACAGMDLWLRMQAASEVRNGNM